MRYRGLAGATMALTLGIVADPGDGRRTRHRPPGPTRSSPRRSPPKPRSSDALLAEEELDTLVAPVALYPDSLLTQVLVASTFPLDIIKADRFITAETDLSDKDRAAKAEEQDWDPSVQVLAGGFPTVVQKMATEIDWTEQLGDAMLAQTDDVLDAVQRQRARAAAVGNLETNEAQVVEQTEDSISIAPAEPDVVYVPQYDATTAYTMPFTAPAVVDTGISTSDVLTTGAIAFGSALLVNEIFDDDDDWDDYWDDGPNIDWDEGDFNARPGINVDGDVNIDRERNVDRDRTTVDGGDRDRVNIDRDRIASARSTRSTARQQCWKPDPPRSRRMPARGVAERKGKEGGPRAAAARDKIAARSGGGGARGCRRQAGEARGRRQRGAGSARKEAPSLKHKDSALKAKNLDAKKAKAAANRGDLSKNKGKAKQAAKAHPQGREQGEDRAQAAEEIRREKLGDEEGQRQQGEGRQGARRQEQGRRWQPRRRRTQALERRLA